MQPTGPAGGMLPRDLTAAWTARIRSLPRKGAPAVTAAQKRIGGTWYSAIA